MLPLARVEHLAGRVEQDDLVRPRHEPAEQTAQAAAIGLDRDRFERMAVAEHDVAAPGAAVRPPAARPCAAQARSAARRTRRVWYWAARRSPGARAAAARTQALRLGAPP